MSSHPDFEGSLRLLEENRVDYVIVGGYAVALPGHPRFTKGIDLFFRATEKSVDRIRRALVSFGFNENDPRVGAFLPRGGVLAFGVIPARVDLVNGIDGVSCDEAAARVVQGPCGRVSVPFIGRSDLLRNRMAMPQARDKADVEERQQHGRAGEGRRLAAAPPPREAARPAAG